ncbi:MAG: alanine racemase [Thermohalobaculum sp.]|nr:alanine racemase [Thermohalobaculum sp.]
MNRRYAPPSISAELGARPIEAAADRSGFARVREARVLRAIGGAPVEALAARFGTPLFVYAEQTLRERARAMRAAFESRYPDVSFVWSVKTNYLNAICAVFRDEGWGAEVVSEFEYDKVRAQGFDGSAIVYNGPWKSQPSLRRAIADGALIQIDNWDELARIEDLAEDAAGPIRVGLRIWMDCGIEPVWSRFGFALGNGEAARAAARVIGNPRLGLHTLHSHIGTYVLSPGAYGVATRKLAALRDEIEAEHGHLVPCLNLGGGFPSHGLLHAMPGPAERVVPPIEAYADAITAVLRRLPAKRRPLLRLETGRHLIDDAGHLITRVVAVRDAGIAVAAGNDLGAIAMKEQMLISDAARLGYVLDAGVNLLYTAAWFRIEALPARDSDLPPLPAALYGPLCMAIDVIRSRVELPPLDAGDLLTLWPVGAYNEVQSMQFISYRPAAVLVAPDGTPELIRARETLADVERGEAVPARLGARP